MSDLGSVQHFNPNWAKFQERLKCKSVSKLIQSRSAGSSANCSLGKRKEKCDEEGNISKINILCPSNNDFSLTDEIAIDCEMVGVRQGSRSALGRVTLVNQWGNVVYDAFVRPMEWITDFRTSISGVRPRDLKKATSFIEVQKKVAELIQGRVLVGHSLRNDLKALLLSHPKEHMRDTSEYQPFLKGRRRRALRYLAAEFLGVEIQQGEHCSIEDARAAMLLYQKNKREWERCLKSRGMFRRKKQKIVAHVSVNPPASWQ